MLSRVSSWFQRPLGNECTVLHNRVASWFQCWSFESAPVHEWHLCVVLVVLHKAGFKTGCTAAWHLCITLVV